MFTNTAAAPQTEPIGPSNADKDGEDNAPSPLALSPIPPRSEKSPSPPPLPTPSRPQPSSQSRADSSHSGVLISSGADRECHSPEDLSTLWRQVKALDRYHTAHNRRYPGRFSLPGLAKTTPMIKRLTGMAEPPQHSSNFMTDFDIRYRSDVTLARGLKAVLPQIAEYLDTDDSRDVLKEQTHDTRNMDKELSDDSRDVDKDTADDSRNILKDRATTVEWACDIEVVPIRPPGSTPKVAPSILPALEALIRATENRVRMEMEDDDSSDDEPHVVKMEVDPPLNIKGKGKAKDPIDLTSSDNDSNKENDRIHPGPTWMHYDKNNVGHYRIDIPEHDNMTSAALFIRYVFDGKETILEGCDGKQTPIYRKALHARSADTCPNICDDKLIRDDHLHVLHPQASLKELVDRHIHAINDPGVTAEVVRFCTQTTRCGTFSARLKSLEEDIRMNDDALFETRRRLIHTRLPTRIFNNIYSEPPASPPVRKQRMPTVRGAQGPPDEDDVPFHHPYKKPTFRQPAFCYECFELQPGHQVKDCPSYGQCCFCDSNAHELITCIAPHMRCSENECKVPSWHHHHGTYCSADAVGRLTCLLNTNPAAFLKHWDANNVNGSTPYLEA